MCDAVDLHNALSPALSKVLTLSRLCPVDETDRETLHVALTLLDMIADYGESMRRVLDDLATEGGRP